MVQTFRQTRLSSKIGTYIYSSSAVYQGGTSAKTRFPNDNIIIVSGRRQYSISYYYTNYRIYTIYLICTH